MGTCNISLWFAGDTGAIHALSAGTSHSFQTNAKMGRSTTCSTNDGALLTLEALVEDHSFFAGAGLFHPGTRKPQDGQQAGKVQAQSSEVIICFDVSRSMQAEDVKPDRLSRARILASQIIESLSGNKVGLIVLPAKLMCRCRSRLTAGQL